MDLFPLMLYKHPGREEMHGGHFDTLVVANEDEQDAAIIDGWSLTTDAAKRKPERAAPVTDDDQGAAQLDRDTLKAEATTMGLDFPKNVPTERLMNMIAEAKAQG